MSSKAEKRRTKIATRAKGGRPRRAGVDRYQDGSIVRESRVSGDPEPMAVARAQPHRRELAELLFSKTKHNFGFDIEKLAGSALGRLYVNRLIQRHQYEAGVRYGENMARDRATIGLPPVTVQAMGYGAAGRMSGADVTSEAAREATDRMTKAKLALVIAGHESHGDPCRPQIVARQIALEDRDEATLNENEVGALRLGLNALARLYGITIGGDREMAA